VKSVAYGIEANGQKLGNGGKEAFQIHGGRKRDLSAHLVQRQPVAAWPAAHGRHDRRPHRAIAIKAGNGAITIH
jgi:hypothetical protein